MKILWEVFFMETYYYFVYSPSPLIPTYFHFAFENQFSFQLTNGFLLFSSLFCFAIPGFHSEFFFLLFQSENFVCVSYFFVLKDTIATVLSVEPSNGRIIHVLCYVGIFFWKFGYFYLLFLDIFYQLHVSNNPAFAVVNSFVGQSLVSNFILVVF